MNQLRLPADKNAVKKTGRPGTRRLGRRLGVSVALAGALFLGAAVVFEMTLPGVGDAQARVAQILRTHRGHLAKTPDPTKLGDAVVAVEDKYFYSNPFVNFFYGAARAAYAAVSFRRGDPGGSTIAQQLAKQLYPHRRGLVGKLDVLGLGIKLSLVYSKPAILGMYLNAVYYGNGYWGEAAAARGYFGVAPDKLSWSEASLLAGLVQAPTYYDPLHHFAIAKRRQGIVIDQLADNHYLTNTQAKAAFAATIPLKES